MRFHCWLTHIFLRAQLKPKNNSSYRYFHRKCLVVNYTSFLFFKLFQPSASRPYSPLASGGGKCLLLHSAIDNEPVLHSKWPKHFDLSSYFPELNCTLIKNISLVLYVSVYEFKIFFLFLPVSSNSSPNSGSREASPNGLSAVSASLTSQVNPASYSSPG